MRRSFSHVLIMDTEDCSVQSDQKMHCHFVERIKCNRNVGFTSPFLNEIAGNMSNKCTFVNPNYP